MPTMKGKGSIEYVGANEDEGEDEDQLQENYEQETRET
jgi:hypothetical protein